MAQSTTSIIIRELVDKNKAELLERIQLEEIFYAHLIEKDVFKPVWIQDLKAKGRSTQISDMLDAIRIGTISKYDGFRYALEKTGQDGALELLQPIGDSLKGGASASDFKANTWSGCLWDSENPEGKEIVMLSPIHKSLINDHRSNVCKVLRLDPLWNGLRGYNVVDRGDVDEMKACKTDKDRVSALLDYLEQSPVWKLHAFFRVCVEENQDHVLDLLGINKKLYKSPA